MPFKIGLSLGRTAKTRVLEPRAPSYHAVSVRPGAGACEAANDAKSTRVLSRDAPRLPLERCDRPDRCACRYQHFEDRRDKPRRRAEGSPPSGSVLDVEERRRLNGRRDEDYLDDEEVEDTTDLVDTYYGYRQKTD